MECASEGGTRDCKSAGLNASISSVQVQGARPVRHQSSLMLSGCDSICIPLSLNYSRHRLLDQFISSQLRDQRAIELRVNPFLWLSGEKLIALSLDQLRRGGLCHQDSPLFTNTKGLYVIEQQLTPHTSVHLITHTHQRTWYVTCPENPCRQSQ